MRPLHLVILVGSLLALIGAGAVIALRAGKSTPAASDSKAAEKSVTPVKPIAVAGHDDWSGVELLDHLRKSGLHFAINKEHSHTTLFGVRTTIDSESGRVWITKMKSVADARDAAGAGGDDYSFAWGRFLIEAKSEHVLYRKIRSTLVGE